MRKIFNFYKRSDFARNVGVMFSGNAVAMVLPFLLAPLISRIYSPEDFASFELFAKIMALVAVVGSLRLDLAILLPKGEKEAMALVRLSFNILIGISVVVGALFIIFRDSVGELLNNESLPELLYLLPLGIFSYGALNIVNQFLIRKRDFKEAAVVKIFAAGGNNVTKYGLGLFMPNPLGLSLGQIFGAVFPLLYVLKVKNIREMLRSLGMPVQADRKLIRKYRDFPLINSAHAFYNEGQQTVLIGLISAYYGEYALGLFAFSFRYLKVPLMVFGTSISQVLNERWARELNEGKSIRSSMVKIIMVLIAISIVPFGVLFFFGTPIFAFVFGDNWADAGAYAEIMAPWLFANFIVSPLTMLPILLGKQAAFFRIAIASSVITLAALAYSGVNDWQFETALWTLSLLYTGIMLYILFWLLHIAKFARKPV
ncbi:MAG: lipopolysaccharide biosynthesis protein [Cryomorphaceae bacterium]|nr:oligosaccharide flippase family protein [Flavobacteriales bacterium]